MEPSTSGTAQEILKAIREKVDKYDKGFYRSLGDCDLVVYDNTAWGGFLDKGDIVEAIGRPNDLLGRFRQVHLVTGEIVFLDLFGTKRRKVDLLGTYEIDYAGWVFEQVERLRSRAVDELDLAHIAEELEDLGKSERRALGSHVRNLMIHLLKWEHQPERRGTSWRLSIENHRSEIYELMLESPSLKVHLKNQVEKQYNQARRSAALETGLPPERFPERCPYTKEQLVDPQFLPEGKE
jgi:hypothetical protein